MPGEYARQARADTRGGLADGLPRCGFVMCRKPIWFEAVWGEEKSVGR